MARVFNSPGVYRREIDLSEILVPTGISNGGIVIRAPKGPINRPVLVTNDKEFIETFGEPIFTSGSSDNEGMTETGLIPDYGYGSYAALEFLKQSSTLYVVRDFTPNQDMYAAVEITSSGTEDISASGGISATAYTDTFDTRTKISSLDSATPTANPLLVGYVGPGEMGNDIAITVETLSSSADWLYQYDEYPTADASAVSAIWATSTTISAAAEYFPIASKVFKINVYQKPNGKEWSQLFGTSADEAAGKLRVAPLETFYGTIDNQQDENKNQMQIEQVVNGNSQFIYVNAKTGGSFDLIPTTGEQPNGTDKAGYYVNFSSGTAGSFCELLGGDVVVANGIDDTTGWAIFENREEVPAQILINPSWKTAVKQRIGEIVNKRMDSIAVCQSHNPQTIDYKDKIGRASCRERV